MDRQHRVIRDLDAPTRVSTSVADGDPHFIDFRVVAFKGTRYALKLESIFWRVLKVAATSKNERLGAYIARILDRCPADINKTSAVRVA